MRRFRLVVAFALASLAAQAARGTEQESTFGDPLELEPLITYAREHNPEIHAAESRAAAMAAVPAQVSAYDDPTFSYEAWNFPESFRVDRADNGIFKLSQKVPFPGKRRWAGAMAQRDADMARAETASLVLDIDAQVKRAYYGLWRAHRELEVYSRDKELAQGFARIAERKYELGEVPQADVLRAQVELTRLINEVSTKTLAIDHARAELNSILSRDPGELLAEPETPMQRVLDERPDRYIDLALRRRPEVAGQASAVGREEARRRIAYLDRLPDLELSASRFVNHGERDGFGAMIAVSIPFANRGKYAAQAAEAEARLAGARAEQRRLEDRIRREVAQAHIDARSAELRHRLFVTTHIPQAEQALRVTQSGYETGAIDFLSLIESFRAIEMAHLEHFAAATDFELAYADLERAAGGALDASGSGVAQ